MADTSEDELAEEILRRLDQDGTLGESLRQLAAVQSDTFGRFLLQSIFGHAIDEMLTAARDASSFLQSAAAATLLFYPSGWAPSGAMPSDVYTRALKVYRESGNIDDAERLLARGWNEGGYFPGQLKRSLSLGAGDDRLTEASMARYRLIQKGLEHHEKEEYAASIPILLAQTEGIVFDVTDGKFGLFSRLGDREHLADDTTLAGMAVGVSALQKLIAGSVNETGSTGRLVRHGIMHGRELGYDTYLNSTKALVFLIAVVELARPRAVALSDSRRQAEFEKWAGSEEIDEIGARRDRRGFDHAMDCLRNVSTRMIAEYRGARRYPARSLAELFQGDIGDGLVDHARTTLIVESSGKSYYAYHETPPGFFFGMAAADEPAMEYRFAGPATPKGGIGHEDWRGIRDPIPPDWEG